MAHKRYSITLPEEMAALLEDACRSTHSTRSEFVRTALREHLTRRKIPVIQISAQELQELEMARLEIERGDFVTLDELRDEQELDREPGGAKGLTPSANG